MALSKLPIKTIDRYIIRGFTYSYVVSVVIMISLYVILDLFANIDEFTVGDNKSTAAITRDILSYYSYHSFLYFAQVAGVITLVAASFTLARLQRTNELTAMLAGGISLYRVALPLIGAGMFFNLFWVIDQEFIIPSIANKLVLGHNEADGSQNPFQLSFLKDRNNALLSAMTYIPKQQRMEQLIVMERDIDGQVVSRISADLADWNSEKNCWQLTRGYRFGQSSENKSGFAVSGSIGRRTINTYESDWRPDQLVLRQDSNWTRFLSLRQLKALLKHPNLVSNIMDVVSSLHIRLTQPILNMLLLVLGLPFFLNRQPHNVLVSVGMCMLVAISCFLIAFISQTLAASTAHPAFAAWLPIMIFGPLAAVLMENVKT